MRYPGAVLAAAILATPFVAQAQPVQGLYVGAGVGLDLPQNVGTVPSCRLPAAAAATCELNEHLGFDAIGSVGYGIGGGFRFEIEGDFRRNGINSLERTRRSPPRQRHVRTYGVMANAIYDMDIGVPWLYPYPRRRRRLPVDQAEQHDGDAGRRPLPVQHQRHAGRLRLAGDRRRVLPDSQHARPVRDARNTGSWTSRAARSSPARQMTSAGGPATPATFELHNQFNHTFLLGVRYAFNTPAPPPPPARHRPPPRPRRCSRRGPTWCSSTGTRRR